MNDEKSGRIRPTYKRARISQKENRLRCLSITGKLFSKSSLVAGRSCYIIVCKMPRAKAHLCHLGMYVCMCLFICLLLEPNFIITLSCLGPQSSLSLSEGNFPWQVLPAGGCSQYLYHQKGRFSQRFYFNMKSVLQPEPLLGDVPKFMSAAWCIMWKYHGTNQWSY